MLRPNDGFSAEPRPSRKSSSTAGIMESLCKTNHQVKCGNVRQPPPEPPLATRRAGVFVTHRHEEASTGTTVEPQRDGSLPGGWGGSGLCRDRERLEYEARRQQLRRVPANTKKKKKISLQRWRRGFSPPRCALSLFILNAALVCVFE